MRKPKLTRSHEYDFGPNSARAVVISFRQPAGRFATHESLCDQHGTVTDLIVDGARCYCEESPLIVQPDLLVESVSGRLVGLEFEVRTADGMLARCQRMLENLDETAIRLANGDDAEVPSGESDHRLEVVWSATKDYERRFGQLDFGLWAFLYPTPNPTLFLNGGPWTQPVALVCGDVQELGLQFGFGNENYRDLKVDMIGESVK